MKNQKGFSLVEGLLIIIAITLVSFAGWYVWNSNQNSKKQVDSSAQSTANSTQSDASAQVAKVGEKFTFKELGVQIVLPIELDGLSYSVFQSESVTGQKMTSLSLDSPTLNSSKLQNCGDSKDEPTSVAVIGKTSGSYPVEADVFNTDGRLLKQFDGFYFWAANANGEQCAGDSAKSQDFWDYKRNLNNALDKAFKEASLLE